MVSEAKLGCCKLCGNRFHRSWQCPFKQRNGRRLHNNASERRKVIKELDTVFSQYIRLHQLNQLGYNVCYTCGRRLGYSNAQACHFINRRYLGTRWDEDNVKVGCNHCNVTLNGNLNQFAARLRAEVCSELEVKKNRKPTDLELQAKLTEYKNKLKEEKNGQF